MQSILVTASPADRNSRGPRIREASITQCRRSSATYIMFEAVADPIQVNAVVDPAAERHEAKVQVELNEQLLQMEYPC